MIKASAYLVALVVLHRVLTRWLLASGPPGYGLSLPLLLTLAQLGLEAGGRLLGLLLRSRSAPRAPEVAERVRSDLLALGGLRALDEGLKNVVLVDTTLALSQAVRSAAPVVTTLYLTLTSQQLPRPHQAWTLLLLGGGAACCLWFGNEAGSPHSTVLCALGPVVRAGTGGLRSRLAYAGVEQDSLPSLGVSLLVLLPAACLFEFRSFIAYTSVHDLDTFLLVLLSALLAAASRHATRRLHSRSPAWGLGGHQLVLVLATLTAAFWLLGEHRYFTPAMLASTATTVVGFAAYAQWQGTVCLSESEQLRADPAL